MLGQASAKVRIRCVSVADPPGPADPDQPDATRLDVERARRPPTRRSRATLRKGEGGRVAREEWPGVRWGGPKPSQAKRRVAAKGFERQQHETRGAEIKACRRRFGLGEARQGGRGASISPSSSPNEQQGGRSADPQSRSRSSEGRMVRLRVYSEARLLRTRGLRKEPR